MKSKEIPLKPGKYYHIYNRGNNREQLFFKAENYRFFLRRYEEYLSDSVETFAFCLLGNHFHLLVRVKEASEWQQQQDATLLVNTTCEEASRLTCGKTSRLPTQPDAGSQFHRLFTSYAKAINKQEGRCGSLFHRPFKRIEITSTEYFRNLVFYIHANPQLHGIIDDFRMYPWSSYNGIISEKPSKLERNNVLEWFDNKENFVQFHAQKAHFKTITESVANLDD